MSHGLTPLLKAAIGFAYVGGFGFLAIGVYLTYRRRRLHPLAARLRRGDLDFLDRGSLRLGDVCAVRAGHPPYAVVVAIGHDVGWAAGVSPYRLHLLLRDARTGRCRARAPAEFQVPLAQAHHPPGCRPRRRLRLGLPVQRDPGSTARCLLLRPRDPRACAMGRNQTPIPPLRRPRHGGDGHGLRLPPRADGSRRTNRYRSLGPQEFAESSLVNRSVHRRRCGRRKPALRSGLHASSRDEAER